MRKAARVTSAAFSGLTIRPIHLLTGASAAVWSTSVHIDAIAPALNAALDAVESRLRG